LNSECKPHHRCKGRRTAPRRRSHRFERARKRSNIIKASGSLGVDSWPTDEHKGLIYYLLNQPWRDR
jgi:hypothetical protein